MAATNEQQGATKRYIPQAQECRHFYSGFCIVREKRPCQIALGDNAYECRLYAHRDCEDRR